MKIYIVLANSCREGFQSVENVYDDKQKAKSRVDFLNESFLNEHPFGFRYIETEIE